MQTTTGPARVLMGGPESMSCARCDVDPLLLSEKES
jgi:hypothetical protein